MNNRARQCEALYTSNEPRQVRFTHKQVIAVKHDLATLRHTRLGPRMPMSLIIPVSIARNDAARRLAYVFQMCPPI